ncbi:hypothetical protein, partial [Streptomyces sp. NPDC019507]|uniref:hypothetical protein n=1 Tax=Streptomyces sp. NPDC019507 TaxID=3154689 RepID=UPI00340FF9FF
QSADQKAAQSCGTVQQNPQGIRPECPAEDQSDATGAVGFVARPKTSAGRNAVFGGDGVPRPGRAP